MNKINFIYKNVNKDFKTILFLHGWGCNKNYFKKTTEIIDYANTIIIDLPGFGENDELTRPFKIEDFVEEITLFLSFNNFQPDMIIGHSFGGKLAVFLAKKIKVKSLILLSPSIINKRKSLMTLIKIFLYKIIKRIKFLDFISKKMGSEDYKSLSSVFSCESVTAVKPFPPRFISISVTVANGNGSKAMTWRTNKSQIQD